MSDDSRPITFACGDDLTLEGVLHLAAEPCAAAVVTHPHPLMGGDMHNPVPVEVARALAAAGVTTLRFNFRGTGSSGGVHGEGGPERDDVRAAIAAVIAAAPGLPVVGVGYSFGADVLLATTDSRLRAVVAVAPPLRVLAGELGSARGQAPTLVLAPAHDQFCPPERAHEVAGDWPDTDIDAVAGADHFLVGAARRAADRAVDFISSALGRDDPAARA